MERRLALPAALVRRAMITGLSVAALLVTAPPRMAQDARTYSAPVPLGLELYMPVPEDNPMTGAAVALGRRLFFDASLSADGRVSCASCHRPELAFADSVRFSRGVSGRLTVRNTPSVLNAGWARSFFRDGRTTSLEEQVLEPIADEREMARPVDELVRALAADTSYARAFAAAFDSGGVTAGYGAESSHVVTAANLGRALATYVRTLRSGDSPMDRFAAGDVNALSPAQRAGYRVFVGKADCAACHGGPLFTDQRFHDTGTARGAAADIGREAVTGAAGDRHRFRTPSLRNVALTAPYMHDGSLRTLEEVIEFYDAGGRPGPNLAADIRPLGLTPGEKASLRAYLDALTGSLPREGTAGAAGPAPRARPPAEVVPGIRILRDVIFRIENADTLRLDLLLPEDEAARRPAVVFVGDTAGPRRGERSWYMAEYLAARGFAVALIDQRPRAVGARIPIAAAVSDAKLAVRWLRAHADEHGIDRARIGMAGVADGAVVAALAGLPHWFGIGSNDNVRFPAEVQAVALLEPLLDFADPALPAATQRFLDAVLGVSPAPVAGGLEGGQPLRERISPVNYFGDGATRDVREHVPPFLLVHGTRDERFPWRHTAAFARELRAHDIAAHVFTGEDAPHGFVAAPQWRARTLETLERFFRRVLTDTSSAAGWPDTGPKWSPDGAHIAFTSTFGGEKAVWVVRADGAELRRITPGSDPAWSPDGTRLVHATGEGRLAVIGLDGTGFALLTSDTAEFIYAPAWSPDGAHIAYSSWADNQLHLLRLADGHVRLLTDTPGGNGCGSWFPDGERIAFHSLRDGQAELYVTSIVGTAAMRLTDSPSHEFCPVVSPDGRRIALHRRAADIHAHIDVIVMAVDGTGEINLTDHPANDRYASWSPDGNWIAFASTRGGNHDVYVIRADGTGLRRLTYR